MVSFSRHKIVRILALSILGTLLLVASPPQDPPKAQADLAKNFIKVVYIIPKGAPQRDAAPALLKAAKLVQQQWAGWGWTFRLEPTVATLDSPLPCTEFQSVQNTPGNERVWKNMEDPIKQQIGMKDEGLYLAFAECSDTGWAAQGGGQTMYFFDGVIREIVKDAQRSGNDRGATGAIGHELGHTFGLPHENCFGKETSNGNDLAAKGLPGAGSHSLMCNDSWPQTNPPMPYQRKLAFETRCEWLAECSGDSRAKPSASAKPEPVPAASPAASPAPSKTPAKPPATVAEQANSFWRFILFLYLMLDLR